MTFENSRVVELAAYLHTSLYSKRELIDNKYECLFLCAFHLDHWSSGRKLDCCARGLGLDS